FPVALRLEERYRVEHVGAAGERVRSFDALTHTAGVDVTRHGSLRASCEYSLREFHGYAGLPKTRTELGKLFVSQNVRSGTVEYELSHNVTSLQSESRVKNIVYVGAGRGHYDSTGTFRGRGDYEVQILDLDSAALTADAATVATLAIRPFRATGDGAGVGPYLRSLTASTFFRSTGLIKNAPGVFSLLLSPAYSETEEALRGSSLFREELETTSPARRFGVRYRYERSGNLNHQYENLLEKTLEESHALRIRTEAHSSLTVELEQTWRARSRKAEVSSGVSGEGRTAGPETVVDVRYRPLRSVEAGLFGSFSVQTDVSTQRNLQVSKLSPSVTYAGDGSTRARLMVTVSAFKGDMSVLNVTSGGGFVEPNRSEIVFSLDHRAGQHLTLSGSVSSRRTTGSSVTDGRVEARANF
ncbi:MAG: hypothetical protein V2A71_07575, partial [Candidatus Eisenbacteria bacterium]